MDTFTSFKNRLRHTIRLDRTIRFVWQAGPVWFLCSSLLVVFQVALPLVFIYLGRYRHPVCRCRSRTTGADKIFPQNVSLATGTHTGQTKSQVF